LEAKLLIKKYFIIILFFCFIYSEKDTGHHRIYFKQQLLLKDKSLLSKKQFIAFDTFSKNKDLLNWKYSGITGKISISGKALKFSIRKINNKQYVSLLRTLYSNLSKIKEISFKYKTSVSGLTKDDFYFIFRSGTKWVKAKYDIDLPLKLTGNRWYNVTLKFKENDDINVSVFRFYFNNKLHFTDKSILYIDDFKIK